MIPGIGLAQITVFLSILILLIKPCGWYLDKVYSGYFAKKNKRLDFLENKIYKICNINPQKKMNWKRYLSSILIFNFLGIIFVYLIQRLQFFLPLNPQKFPALAPDLAFNTAVSFVTNTNWQAYAGETTMSYLTQMLALGSQNFISAASGMCLLIALIRGLAQFENADLGNFWTDLFRSIIYILLPLAFLFAIFLVSQGVIQNLKPNQTISLYESHASQTIPMGPVASQIAIKQIGTNGGGFFNVNSAHPFENPTPLTNFFETLMILLIPAAFCYTFGIMVNDRKQGWAILIAILLIFVPFVLLTTYSEQSGNPILKNMGINDGNMQGKETRFGITSSTLWTVASTASANGSLNSTLEPYLPLSSIIPLWLMHLEELVFGGIGSGLCSMIIFVIITVFITGLMVGRTPEYLGKKIEPYEMKMAAFVVILIPFTVLFSTAVAVVSSTGVNSIANPGPHGFTEILYGFSSLANNNGSSLEGLNKNTLFFNLLGALVMLIGRFWLFIPALAIAGNLSKKKKIPKSSGTLETHTPLFIIILITVIFVVGALSFLPALSLGPIVEHFILWERYGR